MKKHRTRIIKDKKERGEWAESVFIARASEQWLRVSKPWGDSNSFDCVVGRPGKFVAVQVKCTVAKLESGKGYICSVCSSHKAYRRGAFDFLAAYVVLEDRSGKTDWRVEVDFFVHPGRRGKVGRVSGGVAFVAGGFEAGSRARRPTSGNTGQILRLRSGQEWGTR